MKERGKKMEIRCGKCNEISEIVDWVDAVTPLCVRCNVRRFFPGAFEVERVTASAGSSTVNIGFRNNDRRVIQENENTEANNHPGRSRRSPLHTPTVARLL